MEDAIVGYYATIGFPADLSEQLRNLMHEVLADEEQSAKLLHQQLTAELLRLIESAMALLDSRQNLCRKMGPDQRRQMNQAIFEKLYLLEERSHRGGAEAALR